MDRKRILVIDDEPLYLECVKLVLREAGYESFVAVGGPDAVRFARGLAPDLILLTLDMRGLDGFDIQALLQEDETTADIPIAFFKGKGDLRTLVDSAGIRLGALAVHEKPEKMSKLLACVRRSLRLAKGKQNGAAPKLERRRGNFAVRGRLRVDLDSQRVWFQGRLLPPLKPRRFSFIACLLRHKEGASNEILLDEVWKDKTDRRNIAKMVQHVREAFGPDGASSIVTISDGYKLVG